MLAIAFIQAPLCASAIVSYANAEKVVKAPKNPTIANNLNCGDKSVFCAINVNKNSAANAPIALTINVASAESPPNLKVKTDVKYRAIAPNAPPSATNNRLNVKNPS